jgi:DsbC/DsbD-like thiol-disulfide interchange protein
MASMLRIASTVIFLISVLFPNLGQAQESPPWAQGLHSRARLISGGMQGDRWIAGIEIALDPGFKTYWRNPGDSGLPPRFDWSGSENVSAVDIQWPAPSRHEDASGVAYIYADRVVLPALVKAKEPGKPIRLALAIDYGICKDICIPAHAELKAVSSDEGPGKAAIGKALAKVPRPQLLGQKGEIQVTGVEPKSQDKGSFIVTVHVPDGTRPALFAEGPENWYLSTSLPDDANRFTVTIEDKPKDAAGLASIRLTLVAGERAIETDVSLDVGLQPR